MIIAFIVALVVAIFFIILWSEERDRAEKAEYKVELLTRQLNKYKKKRIDHVAPKPRQKAPSKVRQKPEKFILDQNKLAELKAQTQAAQELLSDIFVPDEEEARPVAVNADPILLERLFAKEVWTRDEVLEMLEPGAMLGSVLEKLNDYAYEKVGDVVVEEDGENIYVMTEYKDKLI